MTLPEKEHRLIAELASLPETQARLAWLIENARQRPLLPPELRVDANRVEGCLSALWFVPEFRDGRCWFRTESDSLFVKAMAGLICDFYSGRTPEEITAHDPGFLSKIGFSHHLTPTRRNTLGRVGARIQAFAAGQTAPARA